MPRTFFVELYLADSCRCPLFILSFETCDWPEHVGAGYLALVTTASGIECGSGFDSEDGCIMSSQCSTTASSSSLSRVSDHVDFDAVSDDDVDDCVVCAAGEGDSGTS
eukprot:4777396-Pyramimonas_sp.AAC.1